MKNMLTKRCSVKEGGNLYKILNKDVNEFNKFSLSLFSMFFIFVCGLFSYFMTNSFAWFTYALTSDESINVVVDTCKREKNYEYDKSNATAPVLSENMIPVYYDECDDVWRKADSSNVNSLYKWYNYDEKIWANSVTVSSSSRSTYKDASLGTEIKMDDILTMQVWIPRYKYKVWNYNLDGTVTSVPQKIEIIFEEGTSSTGDIKCANDIKGTSDGTGSGSEPGYSEVCSLKSNNTSCTDSLCNGKTYTHPAFTFGDTELTGFWVGKFEVSSDIACTATDKVFVNQQGTCNVDTIRPLVKPNATVWRGAMVSVFQNNIMAMNDNDNKYGFDDSDDVHMIKNMEWGAIIYLSHSKYGINNEVKVNSFSGFKTGCGPQSETSLSFGSVCNSYNTDLGKSASTTGNVYGVYDMSGGAYEYTMSDMISPDGVNLMSGQSNTAYANYHSGYIGILHETNKPADYLSFDGTYSFPDDKYIDKYSFATSYTKRNKSKLGDGVKEVLNTSSYNWYSDNSYQAFGAYPWILRGGSIYDEGIAGIFNSFASVGYARNYYTSRLVISK